MTIATSQPETNNSASGKENVTTDFPITAPAANPVFYRTYSRKLPAGRESWEQVNKRNLDGLKKLGGLNEAEINLMQRMQQEKKALPSAQVAQLPTILTRVSRMHEQKSQKGL